MKLSNYHYGDCPICGCHGTLLCRKDKHGYYHQDCSVCNGCCSLSELAEKFNLPEMMHELYLDGLREESEQVEVITDKLAENKNIPLFDTANLAEAIVDEIFLDVKIRAERELQEGLEDYREMLDAVRGRY